MGRTTFKSYTLHNDVIKELIAGTGIKFAKRTDFQTLHLVFRDKEFDTAELEVAHQKVIIPRTQALKIVHLIESHGYSHLGRRPRVPQPRKLRA